MDGTKRKRSSSTDSLKEINKSALSKVPKRLMEIHDETVDLPPEFALAPAGGSEENPDALSDKNKCKQNTDSRRLRLSDSVNSGAGSNKPKQISPIQPINRVLQDLPTCGGPENSPDNIVKKRRMDAFRTALERIQELQQSLGDDSAESDSEHDLQDHLEGVVGPTISALVPRIDAHTLGFIACAQETMKYLMDHGIPRDDPMVINLRKKLIEGIEKL